MHWKHESRSLTKTVPPSSWGSSDNFRNATDPVPIAAAPQWRDKDDKHEEESEIRGDWPIAPA